MTSIRYIVRNGKKIMVSDEKYEPEFILDTSPHDPYYCQHFGCGKQLSLIESLAGNFCTQHMNQKTLIPYYHKIR